MIPIISAVIARRINKEKIDNELHDDIGLRHYDERTDRAVSKTDRGDRTGRATSKEE
ncbi:MAG: hypothetical protein AB2L14_33470 [Candidatus Xenobiia bacterium LiM19]